MVGDVVGRPGRRIVERAVPLLRRLRDIDFVVVNGENAAGGSGLTPDMYRSFIRHGVDCVTMGDHVFRRSEIQSVLQSETRIVRPANYPSEAPGREFTVLTAHNGVAVGVINLLGRVFMRPVDCYFAAVDRVLSRMSDRVRVILVDFHAEATSDKQLLGRYLDGKVSAVLGTHTHVPTADSCILPGGTAFQCDVGMTGPHDSIIGRRVDRVMRTTRTFFPTRFDVATGDVRLNGAIVTVNPSSGVATDIERVCLTDDDVDALQRESQESQTGNGGNGGLG